MSSLKHKKVNVYLAMLVFSFSSSLVAQTLASSIPPEYDESIDVWITPELKSESPFYKGRFLDEVTAQRIKQGQILSIAREMVSDFDERDWGRNEPRQQKILNQLQRLLIAMKVSLNAQGIDGAIDLKSEQNIFLNAMNSQGFGLNYLKSETVTDSGGEDVPGYFAETENEFNLYDWVEDGDKVNLLFTSEQIIEWRLLEDALTNLLHKQIGKVSGANIRELENAVTRWENFMDKGYSQMPWESAINGLLIKTPKLPELGPPDRQYLFMHPTLGLEFSTEAFDETRVKEVLHIELLGHIWYRGLQLEKFSGLSLTASFREDLDPGIGVLFHIKRNWSVGVSWHDADEDPFLFFSVDLFRFAKQNATPYVEKYETLLDRLQVN